MGLPLLHKYWDYLWASVLSSYAIGYQTQLIRFVSDYGKFHHQPKSGLFNAASFYILNLRGMDVIPLAKLKELGRG